MLNLLTPSLGPVGGVESVTGLVIDLLVAEGICFTPRTLDKVPGPLLRCAAALGIPAHRVFAAALSGTRVPYEAAFANGEYGWCLRTNRAVVLFHGSYAGYAQALLPRLSRKDLRWYRRLGIDQVTSGRGRVALAVSERVANSLRAEGLKVRGILSNPVSLLPRESFNCREDACVAIMTGNWYAKGGDVLVRLASRGVKIDVVGIDQVPQGTPSNLRAIGVYGPAAMPTLYQRYKAVLVTSRFEGCSMALLEGLAAGVPVLTMQVGNDLELRRHLPEMVCPEAHNSERAIDWFVETLETMELERDSFMRRAHVYLREHHSVEEWRSQLSGFLSSVL